MSKSEEGKKKRKREEGVCARVILKHTGFAGLGGLAVVGLHDRGALRLGAVLGLVFGAHPKR